MQHIAKRRSRGYGQFFGHRSSDSPTGCGFFQPNFGEFRFPMSALIFGEFAGKSQVQDTSGLRVREIDTATVIASGHSPLALHAAKKPATGAISSVAGIHYGPNSNSTLLAPRRVFTPRTLQPRGKSGVLRNIKRLFSQPLGAGERSGSQTRIATTGSVSLCTPTKC